MASTLETRCCCSPEPLEFEITPESGAMQDLSVLSVINSLGGGGAERSLVDLAPYLRARGISIHVVCSYFKPAGLEEELRTHGIPVTYLKHRSFLSRVLELRKIILNLRPDLVHTTIIESDILGRIAAFRSGTPVASSLVNTSYCPERLSDPHIRRWRLKLVKAADSFTARTLTSAFHALTEAVAQDAVAGLGVDRSSITVVGRARNPQRLSRHCLSGRRVTRKALGVGHDERLVISVGRQEYQKGHVVLLNATAELIDDYPQLKVIIAGRTGAETDRLRGRIGQLGIGDVVQLMSFRSDLPDLLAAADLFAFPSLYEGFGGSLLEAMSVGVPAIASDLPALREVGGPCVEYFEAGNSKLLADAIGRLLSEQNKRRALATCARKRVDDLFGISELADAYASWFRKVSQPSGQPK